MIHRAMYLEWFSTAGFAHMGVQNSPVGKGVSDDLREMHRVLRIAPAQIVRVPLMLISTRKVLPVQSLRRQSNSITCSFVAAIALLLFSKDVFAGMDASAFSGLYELQMTMAVSIISQ